MNKHSKWTLCLSVPQTCVEPKNGLWSSWANNLFNVQTMQWPLSKTLWLDSNSSFDMARMSKSQQLVWNKSLKVDFRVESSASHSLHVAKNSIGIGSVQSLSKLIKAVAFCTRGIRDVFIQSWPVEISTYRSWICKIDSVVARAPLICVLLRFPPAPL